MKTLERLITKAQKTGFAKVNGRMSYWYGQKGELEEKYSVNITNNILMLKHWGTVTLELDLKAKKVIYYYGESKSDRDSLQFMLERFGVSGVMHYYPSTGKFVYNESEA